MVGFNLKALKKNKWILIIIPIIIIFLVLSIILKNVNNLETEELELSSGDKSFVSKLVINEIQTSNKGAIADTFGALYDWIELYNGSNSKKNLTGYSLSDKQNSIKWAFPNNTIIEAKSYLIVYLAGKNMNGLYANFKLSSAGKENLVLRNANKKIVDAIETISLSKNQVMARDLNGKWVVYSKATPGYINTSDGYEAYIKSIKTTEKSLLSITEILPNNKGHFKDSYGEYSGYIEITNTSSDTVNISSYTISNDEETPFKYQLPSVSLAPNQVFLLFTSNRNNVNNGEYHANFSLKNKNGIVTLSSKGKIVEEVTYTSLTNGLALIKNGNDYYESGTISPGYLNNNGGVKAYQKKYLVTNKTLIISEVMTSNYSYLPQNGGKYYDYIEIYNNSNKKVKLSDYYLSTNDDEPKMYQLPNVELKAKNYYIIMASGDSNLSNNSYKHANFKLGDNEGIFIFKDKKIIDSIFVSNIPTGYSMGKNLSYGIYYYSNPTPLKANNDGVLEVAYTPSFSLNGGVYNNSKDISLMIKGEGVIYYTLDGSNPTPRSNRYNGAIKISKTTVVKAMSVANSKKNSDVVTSSYIVNENHTLPVMSLSLNPSDFRKIQSNAWNVDYEVSSYAEFFEKDKDGFVIPCGLKLFGGSTRGHAKKSFSINFSKKYGEGTLNYHVFENRDFSAFDSLVLRTASQDEQGAFIRDIVGTSLMDDADTKALVQAYKPIILYINGSYWGVYFIREKVNTEFVSNNFNTNNTNTTILRIDGEVKSGSNKSYQDLLNYIRKHDLSNSEAYNYVKEKIDIDSLIDFWVAETYVTNNDIVNCRFISNPDVDKGKWKYVFYDLDFAFYNFSHNYYNFSTSTSGMTINGYSTELLRNMMKNNEFRKRYVERLSYQMENVWNKEKVLKRIDEIVKVLTPEMPRNFKRWNFSMSEWEKELNKLKNYVNKRESYLLKQTQNYFKLSNSQMKEYFGG